jgi:type I restriction enzyme, S subunit
MDTKALRQKILDLAIHGKLVPQDPNDEPASVLLQRIREEKERLIKEGKIKKGKKAVKASEAGQYPYLLPEGWVWTTLGDVAETSLGKMLDKSKKEGQELPYLRNTNVRWHSFEMTDVLKMCFKENEIERFTVKCGDLIVCEGGEPGRCAIWDKEYAIMYQKALHRIRCCNGVMNRYLAYIFECYAFSHKLRRYFTGSTIKHLTGESLASIIFPLPPLAEQHRIVKEIERWFSLIDKIENGKESLKSAVKQAKAKILDLAIHGKLVPQDPADEPASELLRRINPKAEITSDNAQYGKVPFNVPESWVWTTLGEISNYGTSMNVSVDEIADDEWVLELEDIEKDSAYIVQHLHKGERQINGVRHKFSKGDILYSKLRTYLNKVLVAPNAGYCTTEIVAFRVYGHILNDYICHVLRSQYFLDYTLRCGYGVKMPRLSTSDACKGFIPVPPLAEQRRIVAKIEELFAQLDLIEAAL